MSDSENFGITIFEALWSGLPVIINSKIDYWPFSGFKEIDAIHPSNLNESLSMKLKKFGRVSKSERKNDFQKNWLYIQRKSKDEFLYILKTLA